MPTPPTQSTTQPGNAGVLRYLAQGEDPASVRVERPGPDVDTWRLGAHPDVVEWLWTNLNGALPRDMRHLVAGGAALVDSETGRIVAVALGTQYAIRLAEAQLAEARAAGFASVHTFRTVGRTLDLEAAFGPAWVFGQHDPREAGWLAGSIAATNL